MSNIEAVLAAHKQVSNGLSAAAAQSGPEGKAYSFGLEPGQPLNQANWIVGVGIGSSMVGDLTSSEPGSPVLVLYTAEPMSDAQAANYAASAYEATALDAGGVDVRAVHTGPIDLYAHRFRLRAAPAGISVGHPSITAGTAGALCRGRSGERRDHTLLLSNNHVLANVNAASAGDEILQPGPYDGGKSPTDVIGGLERFISISFTQANLVDAATARVDPGLVRPDTMYVSGTSTKFMRIGTQPIQAVPGMDVGKSGRTTQLTAGRVREVGVAINVNMGGGRIAHFVDQISIVGTSAPTFSQGGDSGSLIWRWSEEREPVGLLFAGGGALTFANPIQTVLDALDVDLI